MRAALLLSVALAASPVALAQVACDPVPILAAVTFAPSAVALSERERTKLLDAASRASAFPVYHVAVEPKAALSEGAERNRLELARARGAYVRGMLARTGIPEKKIELLLTFFTDPWEQRTLVSIYVDNVEAMRKCLDRK